MHLNPFFSILTISFNQSVFLSQCFKSLKLQSFDCFEHIVSDPGSTDGSLELIKRHVKPGNRIIGQDTGPSSALNLCLSKAKGNYVLVLNSDDYLLPDALLHIYNIVRDTSYPDLLLFGGYKLFEDSTLVQSVLPGQPSSIKLAIGLSYLFHQGLVIKRSIISSQQIYFNEKNKTSWDYEHYLKLLSLCNLRIYRSSLLVSVFRIHNDSLSRLHANKKVHIPDIERSVLSTLGQKALSLRQLFFLLPRFLRSLLKFILDPWLLVTSVQVRIYGQNLPFTRVL